MLIIRPITFQMQISSEEAEDLAIELENLAMIIEVDLPPLLKIILTQLQEKLD